MSINENPSGPLPDWLLERLAAGDLPPDRARILEARLAREPGGQDRLQALARSDQEILAAHPPAAVADAARHRAVAVAVEGPAPAVPAAPRAARRRWLLVAPAAALAAAALLLIIRPPTPEGPVGFGGEDDHLKGASSKPSLRVYRKAGRSVERLAEGTPVRAGDQLQLAYLARGRRFGAVLSIDGAGRITFHLPEGGDGGRAVALEPGGEVTLPESYQLDAAPAFERFLFVTADAPFDVAPLADVIQGARTAPAGTEAVTFTVRKE